MQKLQRKEIKAIYTLYGVCKVVYEKHKETIKQTNKHKSTFRRNGSRIRANMEKEQQKRTELNEELKFTLVVDSTLFLVYY